MSDLVRHIHSIDGAVPPAPADAPPLYPVEAQAPVPLPAEDASPGLFSADGIVPWLWVGAWLVFWALFLALAAWWVAGGEAPSARAMWMWIAVWAVGGLAVSALLTRAAAQATERASTLRRLGQARHEIVQLEARLQATTASMFQATRALGEATDVLLEQVDTSRDDLRNQISSAQALASALKAQTDGLVSAGSRLGQTLGTTRSAASAPGNVAPEPAEDNAPADTFASRTALASDTDPGPDTVPGPDSPRLPPLGLRPAPAADEGDMSAPALAIPVRSTQPVTDAADVPAANPSGTPSDAAGAGDAPWSWSDMLRTVDGHDDGAAGVLALLEREGLHPASIVDEGNMLDALGTWERQDAMRAGSGRAAMAQLLAIRFDEPARLFRNVIDASPADRSLVETFHTLHATKVSALPAPQRARDLATDVGRAWLFVEAVLAL